MFKSPESKIGNTRGCIHKGVRDIGGQVAFRGHASVARLCAVVHGLLILTRTNSLDAVAPWNALIVSIITNIMSPSTKSVLQVKYSSYHTGF